MTQQFVRPSLLKEERQVNSCEYHAHLFQSLDVHLRAAHAKIERNFKNRARYKERKQYNKGSKADRLDAYSWCSSDY